MTFSSTYGPTFAGFGGRYVPEILRTALVELEFAFKEAQGDTQFWAEYLALGRSYSCRPTPLTFAERISEHLGGPKIFIKREDLNHTGAHKFNNVLGQGLLAKRMGKSRVIAETGAGQHGLATATIAAKLGLDCTVYMGATDVERQYPNVFWMRQMGAEVVPVTSGTRVLKDAIGEALRDWSGTMDSTHYILGTACGPDPFPAMVTWLQSIIGEEARAQFLERTGALPDAVYACVGGGSNALGIFQGFVNDPGVELVAVEGGGDGIDTQRHASRIASGKGRPGVAHGYSTLFLQSQDGQMLEATSVAAGLDYVGVSPILAAWHSERRVRFTAASDTQAIEAMKLCIRREGLIPAIESAHAFHQAFADARVLGHKNILINMSGRGDKDIFTVADALGDDKWKSFLKRRAQ